MNEDFKDMRYLSDLLAKRSELYYFTIDDIKNLLRRLNLRIEELLDNLDPVENTLRLYDKIVRLTDADFSDPKSTSGIELNGAEAFTLLLVLFFDSEYCKLRNKLFYDLYLGVLGMTINNPDEEENI